MIIHHGFDEPNAFQKQKAYPSRPGSWDWMGEWASQSPLNAVYQTSAGGGAEGTPGYLALPGAQADQFYVGATPVWHRPREVFDLRDTRASFYLKAITPIQVTEGYAPHLFIADVVFEDDVEYRHNITGWFIRQSLKVEAAWTFNQVDLLNDEGLWTRYSEAGVPNQGDRSLDRVLSRVGFIGVMYIFGKHFKGVNARGILGLDEFKYNIPL